MRFSFDSKEVEGLALDRLPKHVAIIMDGNGRWAQRRFLAKSLGHRAGGKALEKISQYASDIGIEHLTVYAFSTENWKRSEEEVSGIMDLLRSYLRDYIEKAKKDTVRVDVIGDKSRLDLDIQEQIQTLWELTKDKPGMGLHIALNYGGRDEILRAVRRMMKACQEGSLMPEEVTESKFSSFLDTAEIPDPELLIRTSGEERISNFLLWQLAYTEFAFTDKLWPDYSVQDFKQALIAYQNRDRRFGGRKQ